MEYRMALPYWKVDNLNIWLWIFYLVCFFFFLSIITLLDYQDVFSFANPCFKKKTKTMRYIGRSCSYGESVLILQRKNKAFSFIFPCLMMKPKLRRELLMNWVLVNWKRKMVSINWLNFYAVAMSVVCPSVRPSVRRPFEFSRLFYASALRRPRHYVFGLSVRPSVRLKPEIPSFDLYMGPLVHPTNRDRFMACPSVRPSVRP